VWTQKRVAEQVEENKRKEANAVYRHRKGRVFEISVSLIGVVLESGAQRYEALFWGERLRTFRRNVMLWSSRYKQPFPLKLRTAFTQLLSVTSQKNGFLRNRFPGEDFPEKATIPVSRLWYYTRNRCFTVWQVSSSSASYKRFTWFCGDAWLGSIWK
jgi:hypothetical protein